MKRHTVIALMLTLVLVPLGPIYAKDNEHSSSGSKEKEHAVEEKQDNEHASVGTKELLARIEALEAIVANLGGGGSEDNSVAGYTYLTHNLAAGIAAYTVPGQFHLVGSSTSIFTFDTDGTGTVSVLTCENQQLTQFGSNPPTLAPAGPGCGNFALNGFTYQQNGNTVELTDINTGFVAVMTVSNSGDSLIGGGQGVGGNPNFSISTGSILVGVRIEEQS